MTGRTLAGNESGADASWVVVVRVLILGWESLQPVCSFLDQHCKEDWEKLGTIEMVSVDNKEFFLTKKKVNKSDGALPM